MPKAIDRILIDIIFCSVTIAVTYYAFSRWYLSIPLTFCLYLAFKLTYTHLLNRRHNTKEASASDILFALSLMTAKEQRDFFLATLPEGAYQTTSDNTFFYQGKAYATLVKFGVPTADDCARLVRVHKSVHVISRKIPRDTLLIAKRMGLHVVHVPAKAVRKYLIAHNAVPTIPTPSTQKTKRKLSDVLANLVTRKKATYYVVSSLATLVMAFLVPYTVYYLVFAGVFALLSICCLLSTSG